MVRRPGFMVETEHIYQQVPDSGGCVEAIDVPLIQITSNEIWRRVRSGEPIHCYISPYVEECI